MTKVKLIEVFKQNLNLCEVIATVSRDNMEFLGISEFYLDPEETVPEDEDELSLVIENRNLTWDIYIPNFDDDLMSTKND
jgi:hypothetical protein